MTTEQAIKELKFATLENQMQKNSAEREKTTCPFCGRPVGVSNVTLSTYGVDPPIYCNKCGRALWRRCR